MRTRDDQDELPPQPKPVAVTPPAAPGGVDAVTYPTGAPGTRKPAVRDADPLRNPATSSMPDETKQGEDTTNRATRGEKEPAPQQESPA